MYAKTYPTIEAAIQAEWIYEDANALDVVKIYRPDADGDVEVSDGVSSAVYQKTDDGWLKIWTTEEGAL